MVSAYLLAIRAILPRPGTLLIAAAFPGAGQSRPRPEWLLTWLVSHNPPWDQLLPSVRCYYGAAFELKASAPAIGSLLATPYVLDDGLVVLAIAIPFVARHGLAHGFHSGEINLLGLA